MDCPHCGCNDVHILREADVGAWFARGGQGRCRHCGRRFALRASAGTADVPASMPPPTIPPPIVAPSPMLDPPAPPGLPPLPEGAVYYHAIHCPLCGSADTTVTSTRRPIRQHKCRGCGAAFKSVEAPK